MVLVPAFPLGTVLFPAVPLPLFIFEPRYQKMIRRVLEEDGEFVVCLIKSGQEALGKLAEPFRTGTKARIHASEELADGRMRILALGTERVQISRTQIHPDEYLEAETAPAPFERGTDLADTARVLRESFAQYSAMLRDLRQIELTLPQSIPELIFSAASQLPSPMPEKQRLLESPSLAALAADLAERYAHYAHLLAAGQIRPAAAESARWN